MRSCPDRHKVDSFIYTTENVRRQVSAPVVVEEPAESWDDVSIVCTFNNWNYFL